AALVLFAEEGFHATSTSKVAKRARVSEGLIFRHYKNKDGLLEAVMGVGEAKIKSLYADIVLETDPREVIRKTIEMPFDIDESEYEFWKLQFKLKWEIKTYNAEKMEPMRMALENAFKKLNYKDYSLEADLMLHILDGVASAMLKNLVKNKSELKSFLLSKYNF
ncbi:TetR/AcrR family transcriptional regulator, partial [Fulvivirga sp. RKSG066]|uniref:TetR/AcrR family transcriptional regulator n=1 Tax=Fulvivirga aurantia TaxID=2529383 RepID=UPI0012BB860D